MENLRLLWLMIISLTSLKPKHGLLVSAMRTIKYGSYYLKKLGPKFTAVTQGLRLEVWKMLYLLSPELPLKPYYIKILKIGRLSGRNSLMETKKAILLDVQWAHKNQDYKVKISKIKVSLMIMLIHSSLSIN